jgi:YggT family protein
VNYVANAGDFLLNMLFGALVGLFMLRLLAEANRADFNNPICQFLYRFTNPVLRPLRKVLPSVRRISLAALLIALLLECLKWILRAAMAGVMPSPIGIVVLGIADLVDFLLFTWIVVVFVWSLMSMLSTDRYHPVARFVTALAEPLVRPLRGRMTLGGLDFSPTVVLIILFLARMLIAQPLRDLGGQLLGGM